MDLDNLTDFDLVPLHRHKLDSNGLPLVGTVVVSYLGPSIVLFRVLIMPHDIFVNIFDHRYPNDEGDGHDKIWQPVSKLRDVLKDQHDTEVDIGALAHQKHQVERQESDNVVLGS